MHLTFKKVVAHGLWQQQHVLEKDWNCYHRSTELLSLLSELLSLFPRIVIIVIRIVITVPQNCHLLLDFCEELMQTMMEGVRGTHANFR